MRIISRRKEDIKKLSLCVFGTVEFGSGRGLGNRFVLVVRRTGWGKAARGNEGSVLF